MAQLKCPRCGRVTRDDDPLFPRCYYCREYLVKCKYCRFFDSTARECTHPDVAEAPLTELQPKKVITDPDAQIDCGLYQSLLIVRVIPRRAVTLLESIIRIITLSALLSAVLVMGLVLLFKPKEPGKTGEPQLNLVCLCPDEAEVDEPFQLRVMVWNLDEKRGTTVRIRMNEKFFKAFEIVQSSPNPDDIWVSGGGRYFDYGNLPARAQLVAEFTLRPEEVGFYTLSINVYSAKGTKYGPRRFSIGVI